MVKTINSIVIFVDALIVALLCVFENLSNSKAGLNHHVLARKIQWSEKYFTFENVKLIVITLITIVVIAIVIQVINAPKKLSSKRVKITLTHNIIAILSAIVVVLSLKHEVFLNMNTSLYITFAAIAIFILEVCTIMYMNFAKINRKY